MTRPKTVCILALLLAGCAYYRFETRGKKLAKADVILVPGYGLDAQGRGSWLLWNRVLMAKIVLDEGYAGRIILSGGQPRAGITEAEKMLEYARKLGVPADLVLLEQRARSSVENARFSADLMVENGMRSGLVVTDPWHLTYAIPVFRDAFEERGLELYWTPLDYQFLHDHPQSRPPESPPE
jgi:uncharacterized SAM-binding protein YcdF (DUF218 family)